MGGADNLPVNIKHELRDTTWPEHDFSRPWPKPSWFFDEGDAVVPCMDPHRFTRGFYGVKHIHHPVALPS
jgi:hypothetical protein